MKRSALGWLAATVVAFPATSHAQQQEVRAVASVQPADGVTEELLDMNLLGRLEAHVVGRQMLNTRQALEAKGIRIAVPKPNATSNYVVTHGKRLALIRTEADTGEGVIHSVQVIGIFGDEMRRVGCIAMGQRIAITYGTCAAKIKETFGFTLDGTGS